MLSALHVPCAEYSRTVVLRTLPGPRHFVRGVIGLKYVCDGNGRIREVTIRIGYFVFWLVSIISLNDHLLE